MKMDSTVSIQNVSQSFANGFWMKPKLVLKNISLEINGSGIFGLIGPNGAGKTTLIHLLTGIRKPKQGKVRLFGIPAYDRSIKMRIGYLPERPYYPENMTGAEFLKYMGGLSGLKGSHLKKRIEFTFKEVGLEGAQAQTLRTYSKGMLQRIGIAQAILHEPDFLIFDEPMSGLDPVGRKEVRELILRLREKNKTILFSSHILSDVEFLAHKLFVIKAGELVFHGPISVIQNRCVQGRELVFSPKEDLQVQVFQDLGTLKTTPDGKISLTLKEGANANDIFKEVIARGGQIHKFGNEESPLDSFF
jgi:ABC-2 type transport system ATP-binding protein